MADENVTKVQARHQIGLIGAISYMIGVVGSGKILLKTALIWSFWGIFVTPSTIYRQTRSVGVSLLIWLVAGIVSTFGALSYAELGSKVESNKNILHILLF